MLDRGELDPVDRDALERSLAAALASRDPGRRAQLESMLTDRPWLDVAKFAAYVCQTAALRLRSWESPPAIGRRDGPGAELLDRMLAADVSQWDPDPLAELAKRKRRRK